MLNDAIIYGALGGSLSLAAQLREQSRTNSQPAAVRSPVRHFSAALLFSLYGSLASTFTTALHSQSPPTTTLSDPASDGGASMVERVVPRAAAGLAVGQVALVAQMLLARSVSPTATFVLPRAVRVQILLGGTIVGVADGTLRHLAQYFMSRRGGDSSGSFLDSLPPWVPIKRTETGVSLRQKRREWLEREGVITSSDMKEDDSGEHGATG